MSKYVYEDIEVKVLNRLIHDENEVNEETLVHPFTANLLAMDVESDEENSIVGGRMSGTVFDVETARVPTTPNLMYFMFDAISAYEFEIYEALSSFYGYGWLEDPDNPISKVVTVDTLEILPEHRHKKLGPAMCNSVANTFGPNAIVVMPLTTLQFAKPTSLIFENRNNELSEQEMEEWHKAMKYDEFETDENSAIIKSLIYWKKFPAEGGVINKTPYMIFSDDVIADFLQDKQATAEEVAEAEGVE